MNWGTYPGYKWWPIRYHFYWPYYYDKELKKISWTFEHDKLWYTWLRPRYWKNVWGCWFVGCSIFALIIGFPKDISKEEVKKYENSLKKRNTDDDILY